MNTPLISIVIPVYNTEKYLKRCIDSVLGQSFTNFELILVDDGSKDNSGKICDDYAQQDTRVRVIHQDNKGVSVARNKGIDEAKGEYISFIDSDDWVEENFLYFFCSNLPQDNTILLSQPIFFTALGSSSQHAMSALRNFTTKLFSKNTIEKYHIRFVEGLLHSEDRTFLIDYFSHINEIVELNIPQYHYQQQAEGACGKMLSDISNLSQGLIAEMIHFNSSSYTNNQVNNIARSCIEGTFYDLILGMYQYNEQYKPNNSAVLKHICECIPNAICYFPILYRSDSIIKVLLSKRLYKLANYINYYLWKIRKKR